MPAGAIDHPEFGTSSARERCPRPRSFCGVAREAEYIELAMHRRDLASWPNSFRLRRQRSPTLKARRSYLDLPMAARGAGYWPVGLPEHTLARPLKTTRATDRDCRPRRSPGPSVAARALDSPFGETGAVPIHGADLDENRRMHHSSTRPSSAPSAPDVASRDHQARSPQSDDPRQPLRPACMPGMTPSCTSGQRENRLSITVDATRGICKCSESDFRVRRRRCRDHAATAG